VRLPFVKQEAIKDCGASCLLMIIRYYHGDIPREKLRELVKTTKEGTTAYNIIEASKKLFFSSRGVIGRIDQLYKKDLPCIAHVKLENKYPHFIVIYKVSQNKLLIADPSSSLKVISKEEFNKISTGVFILFTPKKKIPKIELSHELKTTFVSFLEENKTKLVIFLIFSIGLFLFQIIKSFQLKLILEYIIEIGSKHNLWLLVSFFVGIVLMKILIQALVFSLTEELNQSFLKSLYFKVYEHLISLPYLYYRNHSTGEIITRFQDIKKIESIFLKMLTLLLIELPFFIIIISILFFKYVELAIIILGFVGISSIYFFLLENVIEKRMIYAKESSEKINNYLTETILGLETIQSWNYQERFKLWFQLHYSKYQKGERKLLKGYSFEKNLETFLEELFLLLVLFICSLDVIGGKMNVSNLVFYQSLCMYLLEPMRNLLLFKIEYKEARESWRRIEELLSIPKEKKLPYKKRKNLKIEEMKINQLTYKYQSRVNILNNISLIINKGEKVLIYGESGGGKSTFARLLPGLLEPNQGQILINGNNINNYPLSLIREKILYVPQKGYLFTTSILNNITCMEDEYLEEALKIGKMCLVDEFVENKNEGFHFMLEENGYNLSGGERQRIILARALFKNASVYIFDESLSELDPVKERKILENIFKEYKDKIIIMISHRERNQDLFTKKLYFKEGKIYDEDK